MSFKLGDTSHLEELLRHPAMNQKQDSLNQLAQMVDNDDYEIHDKPGGTLITSSPMTDIVKAYTEAYDFGNPFSLEQFKERVLQQQRAEARQAEQQQLQDMSKMGSDEAGDENMGEALVNENTAGSTMEPGKVGPNEARDENMGEARETENTADMGTLDRNHIRICN